MHDLSHLQDLQLHLLEWWQSHGRVLPWRRKADSAHPEHHKEITFQVRESLFQEYMTPELLRDPYKVVVSELMLQQTQVDRVLSKYLSWMEKWPKIEDLAKAELADVLIFWQGLGYNRRARFLWLLSKEITYQRGGQWPRAEEELLKLPGIGKYTARAVLSFAFGQQLGVVDTNVKRVMRRLTDAKEAAEEPTLTEKQWFELADEMLPKNQADPWNQLIMDFGAIICTAKAPKCEQCPVKQLCRAQQKAVQAGYPTYREYLQAQAPTVKKKLVKKMRFKDTDRYFRGRIIDLLRQNSYSTQQLFQEMVEYYGLQDYPRFEQLLERLVDEGLISQNLDRLKLG